MTESKRPKVTPVFNSDPKPPSKVAATEVDPFGRVVKTTECESATAASQHDVRLWHRLR